MALSKIFITMKATIQHNVLLTLILLSVGFMATGCGGSSGTNNDVDTTPNLSDGAPSGVLPTGTDSTTLSVTTDADATCKYTTASGVDYSTMANTFSTSGGSTHATDISGFSDGQTYNYYVRCQDGTGNVNANDYLIAFAVARVGDTYYVSPTGSAAWNQCTYINTPCAPFIAMTNAVAGDTVYFRGGIYSISGSITPYHGLLEPSNSGTTNNPIIFKSYPEEFPIISVDCSASQNQCWAIGTNAKNYITWDGFTLTTSNNKTAGIFIGGEEFSAPGGASYSIGAVFKNSIVIAGTLPVPSLDNYDVTRMEWTDGTSFHNNKIGGLKSDVFILQNDNAALKMYHNKNVRIYNNEIFGSPHGIMAKSDLDNSSIYNNYFHDNNEDFRLNIFSPDSIFACPSNRIYNNVFINTKYISIDIQANTDTDAPADDFQVYNNTIYAPNASWGIYLGRVPNLVVHSNIIIAGTTGQLYTVREGSTLFAVDHNQYGTNFTNILLRRYTATTASYSSFTTWISSGELIGGGNPGTGSLASDPLFVNTFGNMDQLTDFVLATDSPSKGTGRGGADMGANICAVGVDAAC